jgi:putative transposase
MKKSRFSEEKIIGILKEAKAGVKTAELSRKYGVSAAVDASQLRRLKELEGENARLKKMYADLSLTHHALQDAVQKKL